MEVEDLGNDEIRGRELEVSLREDIVFEHNRVVGRMLKALKQEDGITGVIREDREVLLVATPTSSTDRLQEWSPLPRGKRPGLNQPRPSCGCYSSTKG